MKILKLSDTQKESLKTKFSQLLEQDEIKSTNIKLEDMFEKPTIIISNIAKLKIKKLVDSNTGEVGWNGTVIKNNNTYTITDIYVYPQEVTGATVTCDEVETGQWLNQLDDNTFNHLRFQGHSHVNMATTPSSVDQTMYQKYLDNLADNDFYIFLIINKSGSMYWEMHDKSNNVIYYKDDIIVKYENDDEVNAWYKQVSENIKTKSAVTNTPQSQYTQQSYYSYGDYYNHLQQHKTADNNNKYDNCTQNNCEKCKDREECFEHYYDKVYKKENKPNESK